MIINPKTTHVLLFLQTTQCYGLRPNLFTDGGKVLWQTFIMRIHSQLRFDAYPYQETGFVRGTLNSISKVSSDSGFYATVQLDVGLKTNLKNTIQYKSGLKAQALVITKDMRLLERLYYNVAKATSIGK